MFCILLFGTGDTLPYLTSITQNAQSISIPYLVVMPTAKKLEISFQINYIAHYVNALRSIETTSRKTNL